MTRAKVELLDCASHTGLGRKLLKGQPQIITNPSEINYYKNQSGIKVTMLDEVVVIAKPEIKVEPKVEPKIEIEEEKEVENFEDEEEAISQDDYNNSEDEKSKYTRENLKGLKKEGLIEIASELGVFLDGSEKKKEMIDEILEAQHK